MLCVPAVTIAALRHNGALAKAADLDYALRSDPDSHCMALTSGANLDHLSDSRSWHGLGSMYAHGRAELQPRLPHMQGRCAESWRLAASGAPAELGSGERAVQVLNENEVLFNLGLACRKNAANAANGR